MSLQLGMLTFDCHDAAALARFWSAVFDRPVDPGASEDSSRPPPKRQGTTTARPRSVPASRRR